MFIMILLFILLLGVITLTVLLKRAVNFPWVHFYTKGREAGFSFKEINLLRIVAVESSLDEPTSLFWSINQLDRSISNIIIRFKLAGVLHDVKNMYLLSKLLEFRKIVELKLPKYTISLRSTREIDKMQFLKITVPNLGSYQSRVIENKSKYIAITYPVGQILPPGYEFKGKKLDISFWRKDDAKYVFESTVIEDHMDSAVPILYIAHSDSILGVQKRSYVRVDINTLAYLYQLNSIGNDTKYPEGKKGIRCRLMNLSENGASLRIGGHGKIGINVRIQFKLGETMIVMCGVIKGVTFNKSKNISIIRIQAEPLSNRIKNRILVYVYDLFGERSLRNVNYAAEVLKDW